MRDLESYFDNDDDDEEEQIDGGLLPEIAQFKEAYYKEKFGFASVDKLSASIVEYVNHLLVARDVLTELSTCYVVAVEWILRYYYTGVPSWSWYVIWSIENYCFRIFHVKVLSVPLRSICFGSKTFFKHHY